MGLSRKGEELFIKLLFKRLFEVLKFVYIIKLVSLCKDLWANVDNIFIILKFFIKVKQPTMVVNDINFFFETRLNLSSVDLMESVSHNTDEHICSHYD